MLWILGHSKAPKQTAGQKIDFSGLFVAACFKLI